MRRIFITLLFLFTGAFAQENSVKDFAYNWRQARKTHEAKDYPAYLENMKAVVKFRPDNPNMKYNLACAQALAGNADEALALLNTLAEMGLIYDAAGDEDFNALKISTAFQNLVEKFAQNKTPVGRSEVALKLPEKYLFVADYSVGILKVDMSAKRAIKIAAPENVAFTTVDGMYFYKNSLLAIQNGINPQRVMRFFLNPNHDRIERAGVIAANHPLFNEPTLGVLVRDMFYYIANNQWGSFNPDKTIFPLEKLQEPIVLKTKLE